MDDPYIRLAHQAIEHYLKTGKALVIPSNLPRKMLTHRVGTFVSLHTKSGELRGCIGTFLPTKENIAQEIIANAISSAVHDPRFPPVTKDELPDLTYSVDILSKPKSIPGSYALNPKTYGLIVSTPDGRRGLLLPDIPGVNTPEEQFRICCYKAGIHPEEKVVLHIFTVTRHAEKHAQC